MDSDGYEYFGWCDLQWDGKKADSEDAGAQVEVFLEVIDGDDDMAGCSSDYERLGCLSLRGLRALVLLRSLECTVPLLLAFRSAITE